ncbi:MAG: metal-dependent hydrolase [Blastocatellia bacterium]
MDSITQGVLGAAAAQSVMSRRLPRGAGLIGAVSGMAADLDVLIRSSNDPTVAWIFHRHFTHSLIFIPVGSLLAALPFLFLKRFKDHKREVILTSIIGYATHAPLDMFTNYGTQLFWPFTNYRVALDWIAIIDPVYTIPLWMGVIWTAVSKNPKFVRAALLLTTLYLVCFGAWQHHRAAEAQRQLLAARGAQAAHARVMPAPGWLLLWRSVYIADGRLYADGIRTPWFGPPRLLEGGSANAVTFDDLPARAQNNAESRRRFVILRWFSDGLMAPVNGKATEVGDMRITPAVEGLMPLWGLQFDPASGEATAWRPSASIGRDYQELLRNLFFGDPRYKHLPR